MSLDPNAFSNHYDLEETKERESKQADEHPIKNDDHPFSSSSTTNTSTSKTTASTFDPYRMFASTVDAFQRIAAANEETNDLLTRIAGDSNVLATSAFNRLAKNKKNITPSASSSSSSSSSSIPVVTPPPNPFQVTLTTIRDQCLFEFLKNIARILQLQEDEIYDWQTYQLTRDVDQLSDYEWTYKLVLPNLRYVRFATEYTFVLLQTILNDPRLMLTHILRSMKSRNLFVQLTLSIYTNVKVNVGIKYTPAEVLQKEENTNQQILKWFRTSFNKLAIPDLPLSDMNFMLTPWTNTNADKYGTNELYASFLQLCSEAIHMQFNYPPPITIDPHTLKPISLYQVLRKNSHGYAFEPSVNATLSELLISISTYTTRTYPEVIFFDLLHNRQLLLFYVHWIACHYYTTKQQQTTSEARTLISQRIATSYNSFGQHLKQHFASKRYYY
jgi:hypothetical protein